MTHAFGLARSVETVPVPTAVLQRNCAWGTHAAGGDCGRCTNNKVQRTTGAGPRPLPLPSRAISRYTDPAELAAERTAETLLSGSEPGSSHVSGPSIRASIPSLPGIPSIVGDVLRSGGSPLDTASRVYFEPRLGHDLGHVRVHTGPRAVASADAVAAQAYTVGSDIVLGHSDSRRTLAHELTHVVQRPATLLSRVPKRLGTNVTEPKGTPRPFKTVTATFDGASFVLTGDGVAILTAAAQSGRPNTVSAADAKACGGSTGDSYLNNARYVGIADNGPIPEGEYTFRRREMATFTGAEQLQMALAHEGQYVDPSGKSLHGDWGAGRAALRPVRILPPRTCGSTKTRSGFFLHGGVMPGSSGCIDIGDAGISSVVKLLTGYPDAVTVTVRYTQPPPAVGGASRAAGRFMYPKKKNPSFLDRLGSAIGVGDDE